MLKFKRIISILQLIAPVLLVAATATAVIYAWYVSMIQTGEIDASTKSMAIEYKFDDNTKKNQVRYTVKNLAFFDEDSENEVSYIEAMATKLTINLKNNSSNAVNYKIIFQAEKTILKEDNSYHVSSVTENTFASKREELYTRSGAGTEQSPYTYTAVEANAEFNNTANYYYEKDDKSNSYVDCLFSVLNDRNYTTVAQFKGYPGTGVSYEESDKEIRAMFASTTTLPSFGTSYSEATVTALTFVTDGSLYTRSGDGSDANPYVYTQVVSGEYSSQTTYYKDNAFASIDMYLYGVQEVDTALNDDFIYNFNSQNNTRTMRTYQFTLTIIAEPDGAAIISENENNESND